MLDLYSFSFISVLKKVVKYIQIILLRCQCMQTVYAFNYDFYSKETIKYSGGFFLAENFLKIKDTKLSFRTFEWNRSVRQFTIPWSLIV